MDQVIYQYCLFMHRKNSNFETQNWYICSFVYLQLKSHVHVQAASNIHLNMPNKAITHTMHSRLDHCFSDYPENASALEFVQKDQVTSLLK